MDVVDLTKVETIFTREGRYSIIWSNLENPYLIKGDGASFCNAGELISDTKIKFYRDTGPGIKERVQIFSTGIKEMPAYLEISTNICAGFYDDWKLLKHVVAQKLEGDFEKSE